MSSEMVRVLIFGAIVGGVCLILFTAVIESRRPDKGIEQFGKALSKTKDDSIEPARFVP